MSNTFKPMFEGDSAQVLRPGPSETPWSLGRLRGFGRSSLILALLSPFLALSTGNVQKFLLAVVILDIPFQFGTHFFYSGRENLYGTLQGFSFSATTIALFGLYGSWFVEALSDRSTKIRKYFDFNLSLVLYLGFTAVSVLAAQDVARSFFELWLLAQMYLVFLYVANRVRTRDEILFVVFFLLLGCLLESLLMIAIRVAPMPSGVVGPTHIHYDVNLRDGAMRIGGTVGPPNETGAYLGFMLSIAVAVLLMNIGRIYKWLAVAVLGLGGVALIFTFSRGAWLALVLAATMLCLFVWNRRGVSLRTPIALITILLLVYLPFQNVIETRLFGDDKGSAESRIPLMNLAFRVIADHPVLGVGSNNFSLAMDNYLTSEFRHAFLYIVHNKYLLVWAEIGTFGLLAYLAFLFGTLRKGWKSWTKNDDVLSILALGLTAAILGHMVHMTVDIFDDRSVTQLLWLAAGLVIAIHRILYAPSELPDQLSSIT